MKRPLSVIIITKHPETMKEIHTRFDVQTSHPRLKLLSLLFKAAFSSKVIGGRKEAGA
ncbi:MAG: hypothetical protein HY960_02420 [Ignavibacteriae bacterium]|nr:hypothetical protein [Ignavibacteriota bacterium]